MSDEQPPEDRDKNQAPQKPVKRRGKPRRSRNEQTHPPSMAKVHRLFGEDANQSSSTTGVEIPPGGVPGPADPRRRVHVDSIEMGKRWSTIFQAVENGEYTWEEFVATLTPAELARGQLMDKDGFFRGRPPKMVPRAFLNACTKELMSRGAVLYKENYVAAIEAMTSIAQDATAPHAARIKAAEFVIERLEGKVPQVVQVSVEDPWQVALEGMVAEVSEDAAITRAHNYEARQRAIHSGPDDEPA